jgi:hypothetical protein
MTIILKLYKVLSNNSDPKLRKTNCLENENESHCAGEGESGGATEFVGTRDKDGGSRRAGDMNSRAGRSSRNDSHRSRNVRSNCRDVRRGTSTSFSVAGNGGDTRVLHFIPRFRVATISGGR